MLALERDRWFEQHPFKGSRTNADPKRVRECVSGRLTGEERPRIGEKALGAFDEDSSAVREQNPAGGSVEYFVAYLPLKVGDASGDRRLGDADVFRRGGERPRAGDRDRVRDMREANVHDRSQFLPTARSVRKRRGERQ
ncbi:MAG: hypothetical protein Q8R02_08815 [Hyphomonadaceae bacterium]|nr:hypothetical protein [Hyphomonadaceae bacterium]